MKKYIAYLTLAIIMVVSSLTSVIAHVVDDDSQATLSCYVVQADAESIILSTDIADLITNVGVYEQTYLITNVRDYEQTYLIDVATVSYTAAIKLNSHPPNDRLEVINKGNTNTCSVSSLTGNIGYHHKYVYRC